MITKEIRIAKRASPAHGRYRNSIKPSVLSELRDGRHISRCPGVWNVSLWAEFLFWRPSWWEKSRCEKITVISAEYIFGNFTIHLKSMIHVHAWHLISINCWEWGSGVAKIDFYFFSICFSIIPADLDIPQPLEEKTIHIRLGRYGKSHFQLQHSLAQYGMA